MTRRNGRGTFAIYALTTPGGDVPPDLAPALRGILEAHAQRHGSQPAGLVVNKALIGDVAQALDVLNIIGLNGLTVSTSGGCLAWEVWAEIGTDGQKPSGQARQLAMFEKVTP